MRRRERGRSGLADRTACTLRQCRRTHQPFHSASEAELSKRRTSQPHRGSRRLLMTREDCCWAEGLAAVEEAEAVPAPGSRAATRHLAASDRRRPVRTPRTPIRRGGKTKWPLARDHSPCRSPHHASSKCHGCHESIGRWSSQRVVRPHCLRCRPLASTFRARGLL